MMNKSKKGITLVEMIICCVLMVLLAGACTAVLVSGQKLFASGSETANSQLEANLLQTALLKALPSATCVEARPVSGIESDTENVSIFFDGDVLTIRQKGSNITVNKVKELTISFKKAGLDSAGEPEGGGTGSDGVRTMFTYEASLEDGSKVTGGMALTNVPYDEESFPGISGKLTELAVSGTPAAVFFELASQGVE